MANLADFSIEDLQKEITERIETQGIKKIREMFKDIKNIENNFEMGLYTTKETFNFVNDIVKKQNSLK